MYVIKSSGEFEKFDFRKIKRTCIRAGCSNSLASKIAREVERKAYDGISTRDVLKLTLSLLKKYNLHAVAARYDLKGALFRIGPAGFAFEDLLSEILKEYGYSTKVRTIMKGLCVSHEVDVIATKDDASCMIECKYHNIQGIYTGLKEALYTYARFLDLKDGQSGKKLKQPWLVCNTKFSDDAIQYAKCKDMRLIGWNYPTKEGLQSLIESKKLYPVTMLLNMDAESLGKMVASDLILAVDLVRNPIGELNNLTKIPIKKLKVLSEEARKIISG